jgi:hypothetical protein
VTATPKAELMRRGRVRKREELEASQRAAYDERRNALAKDKVRTLSHFRRWARGLILDTGASWKLEPFQAAFVRDLFAGRPENWLIVPEGNAKTTLVAGLALYHLQFTLDAAIAVAAAARDQAGLIYGQAEGFIRRSRLIGFELHPGYRRIEYALNRSRLQIFAADSATGDGIIPTLCLIDELHRHRDLGLYRTWRGKLEKRDAQIVTISTAGEPGSEFEQTRERIRQEASAGAVRKGAFVRAATERIVLHEWAVPETGDVEDLRLVKKANPLKAVTIAKLAAKLAAPTMTMGHWRRFVCNLPTRSDSSAITEAEWENARTRDQIPPETPIWLGIDVAWKWDTTALVPLWTRDDGSRVLAPVGAPARILTPPRDGSMLDPNLIEQALTEINRRNPIHTVVMDPSKAEQLASWIEQTFGATVIERGGSSAPEHVVDFERFMEGLRTGGLKHGGDPGLTKHALNAIARVDRFGVARFDRPNPTRYGGPEQERRVIDALTAAAMVNAQSLVDAPVEDMAPSVW